jgi:HK97 family phage major capsid protein
MSAPATSPQSRSARELYFGKVARRSEEPMTREFFLERESVDKQARTAVLSFSSEFPVRRMDFSGREFWEVLDHEHVDMSRMDGAPLLYGHDRRDHLGTTLRSAIAPDKRGRAVVKFSRSAFATEKFQDVEDGILTKTSVGYDMEGATYVQEGEREGIPILRFRNWAPYEVTLCPIPADHTVGVGRSAETTPSTQQRKSTMANEPAASGTEPATRSAPVVTQVTDLAAERARIKDINGAVRTMSEKYPQHADVLRQLGDKCNEAGDGIDAFNRTLVNDILGTSRTIAPTRQQADIATLGLSEKDRREYSILKAVRCKLADKPLEGREKEFNDELTKRLERQPVGFFVPDDIMADRRSQRTMNVANPAAGGYTVGQEILVGEFEEYLRNNMVVLKLGARMISGLVGDVSIPRQLTGAAAYWVSESGSITASEATFGQIVSKPKRIGTSVPYTKQLLAQTSLSTESFIVNDSDAAIAVELDRVALRGTGANEPLGIANMATGDRSTSVTFGGAATWAKYLEFLANIAGNNALLGQPSYVASVASAVKAMTIPKFTNQGDPIWKDGKVGAFRAEWTTQLLTSATPVANMVIFGDFSQVMFLEWAGRDVVVDPYSGKKEGTVEITIQRLMDCVIRRGKSFAISTDTGAA